MHQVQHQETAQLQQASRLPEGVRFDFDTARKTACSAAGDDVAEAEPCGRVQKTVCRTVVSLRHGAFQAHETVRGPSGEEPPVLRRSAELAELVPSGARYGFDLIAYVGVETFLRGHNLDELQEALSARPPAIPIPLSSLWDQQQKFLFYLGGLHEQAAPLLRDYLAQHRPVSWLVDGTTEPDTPVFLGLQDAASSLLLAARKIPSENVDDIAPCLAQAAARYGRPDDVRHDLSPTMSTACEVALPGVPHFVCHYHLACDVGEDLYAAPQAALADRLHKLKLLFRLREQRRGQTEWFRERVSPSAQGLLGRLLAGTAEEVACDEVLAREVLLAFHFWILDYRSDGQRRGFPFDPYTLYLPRRLVRAGEAVERLLARPAVARQAPQVLWNFQALLQQYRSDEEIVAAAAAYERSQAMFDRLREALRLSAETLHGLRQPQELPACEQSELKTALTELRSQLRGGSQDEDDPDRPLAQLVLTHVDKYWSHLVPDRPLVEGEAWERTNNRLESRWGGLKRVRRQTHGRSKLTRDFQALPEEYLLVANLENETYVELVFGGSLEALPAKLAAASREAGSFEAWRRRRHPRLIGQLPRRELRQEAFLDELIDTCDHEYQRAGQRAA
jgi:hypothetical protein